MIQKGNISSLENPTDENGDNTRARVAPSISKDDVTRPLTIPWWLRGKMGNLEVGTEIIYVLFEDLTGIILSRMDGNWLGEITGDIAITGVVTALDFTTNKVSSHNSHVHGGIMAGTGKTDFPE